MKNFADGKQKPLCGDEFSYFHTVKERLSIIYLADSNTVSGFTAIKMVVYFTVIFIMSPIPLPHIHFSSCVRDVCADWICCKVFREIYLFFESKRGDIKYGCRVSLVDINVKNYLFSHIPHETHY